MKKTYKVLAGVFMIASLAGCDEFLTTQPQTIITDEQVWSSAALITNVLANFYDRIPINQGLPNGNFEDFAQLDEGVWSGVTAGAQARNSAASYGYGTWALWGGGSGYGLLRDINLAIENVQAGPLTDAVKTPLIAEMRFIRAMIYFELVKRMGGVPLITEQLIYDFSGNAEPLQVPRATEAAIYDFIGSEMDAIAPQLGNAGSKSRANRYTALALKSRAMLYAGSIARYNNNLVTLPGGEIGIPANRANEYYQKSLDASRLIINSGAYSLIPANGGEGFASVFYSDPNAETIFVEDYKVSQGKAHFFTMQNYPQSIPHAVNANWGGSAISPSLQLVEAFDYLDSTSGEMRGVCTPTAGQVSCPAALQSSWTFYDKPADIFTGKDQRLFGTIITPGSTFAGQTVQLQAGVYNWNGTSYVRVSGSRGGIHSDGQLLTGLDGPVSGEVYVSATGFLVRKHMDPSSQGAQITGTDNPWIFFRLGEIYMNAAEAAFELNNTTEALTHINRLRQRAGFPANSLTSLNIAKIQEERWAELGLEDHRLWDAKRWRIAHQIWDGQPGGSTAVLRALWPYRISRPGHPNHNKYVFDKITVPVQTAPRLFRLGNYYSAISDATINANPKLVRQPQQ